MADLLRDLKEYLDDPRQTTYLMGQIITTRNTSDASGNTFDIIDGQQRCTTLYLVLLWFLQEISRRIDLQPSGMTPLSKRLYTTHTEIQQLLDTEAAPEPEARLPRLILPYSDGTATLRNLLRDVPTTTKNVSKTQERILSAFAEIGRQFEEYFDCDSEEQTEDSTKLLLDGAHRLLNSVLLINLEVSETADALDLFEKLNHRGKGLDDADLIKNMLFQRVDQQYYDEISKHWERAKKALQKIRKNGRIAQMTYLLRSIAWTESGGERIGSRQVYDFWKSRFNPNSASPTDPLKFAEALPDWAEALARLAENRSPVDGASSEELPALQLMRGLNFIQQYPLLLAGRHLTEDEFVVLLGLVERRFVVSAFAYEKPGDFDRVIVKWANAISKPGLSGDAVVAATARIAFDGAYELLVTRAKGNIADLSYSIDKQRDYQRVLLAYLSHKIQQRCDERSSPLSQMLKGTQSGEGGYDLEHVWPKSNTALSQRNHIGNLVLAHPGDQRLALAAHPSEKEAVYATTPLELTRSLCNPGILGTRTPRVQDVLSDLQASASPSLSSWDGNSIKEREALYLRLFVEFTARPVLEASSGNEDSDRTSTGPAKDSGVPRVQLNVEQAPAQTHLVTTTDPIRTIEDLVARASHQVSENRFVSIRDLALMFAPATDPNYKGLATYAVRSMLESGPANLARAAQLLGVDIRSCRLRLDEQTPYESISFQAFDPADVSKTAWPAASFIVPRNPTLFFVFEQSGTEKSEAKLDRVVFWQADAETLSVMEREYERFRSEINTGSSHPELPESKTAVLHVRPKGRNAKDTVLLPGGEEYPKSCFWLNREFVARVLAKPSVG